MLYFYLQMVFSAKKVLRIVGFDKTKSDTKSTKITLTLWVGNICRYLNFRVFTCTKCAIYWFTDIKSWIDLRLNMVPRVK